MLEVSGLDVWYGDARALEGIALTVGEGEVVCVVGPNGAGKSTLVNTLAGILRARAGSIVMDGVDISRSPAHRVCQSGLAIVPEGRRIFPHMSVRENLDLGAYRPGARSRRAETLAWVHELFPRLQERAGQAAGSLSGGEQQMLAIGRALMATPRLLLLDEPSLGLAPIIVDELFEVIRNIHGAGVSVLLVEQNVERALRTADRGYLLSEGRIVLGGSADELIASEAVKEAVLGV